MKLTVMGLGYIGLPTAIVFANHGVEVRGVDINPNIVEKLNNGEIHIEEPGLQEAYENALQSNCFKAETTPDSADVFIISVPTPNKNDEYNSCDSKFLMQALENIITYVKTGNTIIIESTLAPRTMEDEVQPFFENNGFNIGEDLYLVHCPERVLPGKILEELIYNNRIIGGITEKCTQAGKKVYGTFVKGEMIETNAKTAEMSKLVENTFRDFNIALANELTKVCNDLKINIIDVIDMANKHPRVNVHQPGPGVGGHCLAVDPYFIIAKSPSESKLIQKARETNKSMPQYIVGTVKKILKRVKGNKVAVFGLTYKGDVDDIRESPAYDIYEMLRQDKAIDVVVHDSHVKLDFVHDNIENVVEDASLVLILSDHSEYKLLNESQFSNMKDRIIFDTKNVVETHLNEIEYINLGNLYKIDEKLFV